MYTYAYIYICIHICVYIYIYTYIYIYITIHNTTNKQSVQLSSVPLPLRRGRLKRLITQLINSNAITTINKQQHN